MEDWLSIAQAIVDAGGDVLAMPPSPVHNLTGLPYTAEAGEFVRDAQGQAHFLLPRMKHAHRKAEADYIAGFTQALGWRTRQVAHTWEAQGDALRVGQGRIVHTFGQGPDARSDEAVYPEVSQALGGKHLKLRFVADPWFHGNTFMAWYHSPDQSQQCVMVCPDALMEDGMDQLQAFLGDTQIVEISREESLAYATNALQVCGTIIAPEGLPPRVLDIWRGLNLEIVELKLPQLFRRGGGAAVCLSCRLWDLKPEELPSHLLFSSHKDTWTTRLTAWPLGATA